MNDGILDDLDFATREWWGAGLSRISEFSGDMNSETAQLRRQIDTMRTRHGLPCLPREDWHSDVIAEGWDDARP